MSALIDVASRYAAVSPRAAAPRIAELIELGAVTDDPALDPAVLVVEEVVPRIATAWEHGWQPLDLVHATRRRSSAQTARWVTRAVLAEARRSRASERAPQSWTEQLDALASRRDGTEDALLPPRGQASVAEWTTALVALDFLRHLPGSHLIDAPPSQWGRQARPRSTAGPRRGDVHDKTLTRIRALLAKAESTEFDAEAEAFTAKAQDLMTRHAIDEAVVADESGQSVDVRAVRVLIHHPYAVEKAGLLDVIARANRTRAVWNDFASCMTLVGVPTDLDQVEMLFTSALVQATRAMTHAGNEPGAVGSDRSSGFRKAFLTAYALRIGARLTASAQEAAATYGSALVPVLQRQSEAVDAQFDHLFPHVTTGGRRTQFDARGWDAGTRAADEAVLPGGMVGS
ncbi:DUF2786 domain-containing protein [Aeromicrobium chenweiae]|uniref:Uncharacterized protein n=1 Tax=Aeromicrobium chenweiae TaxID=2079793 RepID=A0A2S0WLP0_9ACTN|nr:DUF2786 domain-containing protein [Aeromicrobium chenweiae]AWB92212.1 hypothetical protein C3E78_08370 [Aeromicrobium chenweiae]TGN31502.1 DUF2786 domain-containing protein [Aeromicrobium chenweiae]